MFETHCFAMLLTMRPNFDFPYCPDGDPRRLAGAVTVRPHAGCADGAQPGLDTDQSSTARMEYPEM
jgi:hypothetical protein